MQNDIKFFNFLGIVKKSGKLIEGYNSCEEVINKRRVFLIIISTDASKNTKDKFKRYAEKNNILYLEDFSKEQLGNAIGKDEINILCITDKKIGENLIRIYETVKNNRG